LWNSWQETATEIEHDILINRLTEATLRERRVPVNDGNISSLITLALGEVINCHDANIPLPTTANAGERARRFGSYKLKA
jgi:hypothetical protein